MLGGTIAALVADIHRAKIVCTAALIDTQFESRKKEYSTSLNILKEYGYQNPFIFEAIKSQGPTFLENYSDKVIYTGVNDARLRNKGVNEARSLAAGFKKCNFNDNDIILKLTGRYYFLSDALLNIIDNNEHIDAFVKVDRYGQVFTGCYAMRYKLFKDMLGQLDYTRMEQKMINIEFEVARYLKRVIKRKGVKVMYIETLGLMAPIFGEGAVQLVEM